MPISFTNLAVEDAPLERASGRTAEAPPKEFVDALRGSKERGKAVSFHVPTSEVQTAKGLLRKAAESLGFGVRVVVTDAPSAKGQPANSKVAFQATEKRAYTERKSYADLNEAERAVSDKATAGRLSKVDGEKRAKALAKMEPARKSAVLALLSK